MSPRACRPEWYDVDPGLNKGQGRDRDGKGGGMLLYYSGFRLQRFSVKVYNIRIDETEFNRGRCR